MAEDSVMIDISTVNDNTSANNDPKASIDKNVKRRWKGKRKKLAKNNDSIYSGKDKRVKSPEAVKAKVKLVKNRKIKQQADST